MTTKGSSGRVVLAVILAFALLAGIAAGAGSLYLSGSPDLVAAIAGINEFSPGSEQNISLIIRNAGVDEVKILQAGGGGSGDPPSTARMVTLTLLPGTAPVEIKSDSQMAGDIASGNATVSSFFVSVDKDAAGGTYLLPLLATYTSLASEELVGSESVIFRYTTETVQLDIPFIIRDEVQIAVPEISAGDLNAGGDGYITLAIENTGTLPGENTIAELFQGDESPIVPIDEQVFIGSFPPGAVATTRFKVRVDEKAGNEQYPLQVAVEYKDQSGDTQLSRAVTIGVPVVGETGFVVVDKPLTIYRGSKGTIEVEYENAGATTVYSAQARLGAQDPFIAYDDIAFLGDLAPGDRAVAAFEIGVDKAATGKEYGLDTEIRYRDSVDASRISNPITVRVQVKERTGLLRILYDPVLMSIVIAAGIGCGYYFAIHKRRKPDQPEE